MKEKYIEERIPRWMIFGEHEDGFVDIVDCSPSNGDVVNHVSREIAQQMIEARGRYVDSMVAYWMARPEEWLAKVAYE